VAVLTPAARRERAPGRPALALLAWAVLGSCAAAGGATLRGRVDVRLEWPRIEPRPALGELGMSGPRESPDRRRSVVYLEVGLLGAFEDRELEPAELDQRNEAFIPYVLAVRAGATVNFPNHDRTYHNVFSFSSAKRFDLGRYARGHSKSVRFDKAGVVRVFCDIHAHMSAFILVFAHPFFAVTDAEGRYRIPDVPSGSHLLTVWTDGEARETRRVEVPPGAATLEQDFVVK
jgi:plastocyanin